MIASLLGVCFLLYFFLSDSNQTKQVSVKATSSQMKEQLENVSIEPAMAQEELLVAENKNVKPIAIKEEIKEKVREVIKGVKILFKKDIRVVSIGDSLTEGIGDETNSGGYVGILNHTFEDHNLNLTIENYGKRGNRTDQLLKRLENKKMAASIKHADSVLITIGANDIMNVVKNNFTNLELEPFQQEKVEYMERITAIFNKINELNPNTQIYLIGFYNPFEHYFGDIEQLDIIVDSWNEAGKSVTEEYDNINYVPIDDLFIHSNNLEIFANDHFHPNTNGYKLIAQRVLENLKEISVETEVPTEDIEQ